MERFDGARDLFSLVDGYGARPALRTSKGWSRYNELLCDARAGAARLLGKRMDLDGARVAVLTPRDRSYVTSQWAVWLAGGVFVPLAESHPEAEFRYVLEDTRADTLIVHPSLSERVDQLALRMGIRVWSTERLFAPGAALSSSTVHLGDASRDAMILYTSGTTGRPKGVVMTHGNLRAQVESLVQAWGWASEDEILLVLPLHHVHGIVNVVTCALWSGARVVMLPHFDADRVWDEFMDGSLTLFMAVPTVYHRLLRAWRSYDGARQRACREGAAKLRLMVSGSAALPVTLLQAWQGVTGHVLLERYGMTEFGMALSNPLGGTRRAGSVGQPLPGVEVRLVDEQGMVVVDGAAGEIRVRGTNVFARYWDRSQETAEAFDQEGWFCTGDIAVRENGWYRILGRRSVDIIKTGGFKVSALEIEATFREHSAVDQVAVVGVADNDLGERVEAAVVRDPGGGEVTDSALMQWCAQRLAPYKVPKVICFWKDLPRNAMGKVVKPRVKQRLVDGCGD